MHLIVELYKYHQIKCNIITMCIDDMFEEIEGKPGPDWHRPASDFLKLAPLYDFTGGADERAAKILEWRNSDAQTI